MNKLYLPLIVATLFALPEARAINVQNLKDRVQQRLNQLQHNPHQLADNLARSIQAQYGVQVECEGGFLGWGHLDDGSCYAGMENLSAAMAQVQAPVSRDKLQSVKIVIGHLGEWQPMSPPSTAMVVPYNASPDRLSAYINDQFKTSYSVSEVDLEKMNNDLAHKIHDTYMIKVISEPGMQSEDYYEGLKRLDVAMQGIYGDDKPDAQRASDFGFDTVVIGHGNRNIYQDDGELRVQVDFKSRPGDLVLSLITQVQPVVDEKPGLVRRISNFGKLNWTDVQSFRDARSDMQEAKEWLDKNAQGIQVDCILQGPHAIDVDQCLQGLRNVTAMFRTYQPRSFPTSRMLVGNLISNRIPFVRWVSSGADVDTDQNVMLIDFETSANNIYNRLQQQ